MCYANALLAVLCRETTGPEIWYQTDGKIDILLGGVGTGGTLTGTTQVTSPCPTLACHMPVSTCSSHSLSPFASAVQFLRTMKSDLVTIAVEPAESPVLSGGKPGPHKIQGIGAGFVPGNCDQGLLNEVIQVTSADAIATARALAQKEV